jgi:hypothetical protein
MAKWTLSAVCTTFILESFAKTRRTQLILATWLCAAVDNSLLIIEANCAACRHHFDPFPKAQYTDYGRDLENGEVRIGTDPRGEIQTSKNISNLIPTFLSTLMGIEGIKTMIILSFALKGKGF